jgi:hypothetical protein
MAGSYFFTASPGVSAGAGGYRVYKVPSYLLPSTAGNAPAAAGGGCSGSGPGGTGSPVGSTTMPNTTPAAPIGVSSGITSPQPNNPGGFLGFLNGPRVGSGWPNGGSPTPPAALTASTSSGQSGGVIGGRRVGGSGQGIIGFVVPKGPTGLAIQLVVLGLLAYAVFKAVE